MKKLLKASGLTLVACVLSATTAFAYEVIGEERVPYKEQIDKRCSYYSGDRYTWEYLYEVGYLVYEVRKEGSTTWKVLIDKEPTGVDAVQTTTTCTP